MASEPQAGANTRPGASNRPRTLYEFIDNLRLAWLLIRDERVNVWLRYGLPALVGAYLLLPIDLIPDLIPGLGQLDDIAALWLGLQYFLNVCPPELVAEHRAVMRGETRPETDDGDVVDGAYRVVDE